MVDRALDRDGLLQEVGVSLAQRRVARDLERDMHEPEFAALRPPHRLRLRVLGDVDCVEAIAQGHKDAAVLGVLLGDAEAEDIAVKALGRFLVGDPQQDVADTRQVDHRNSPSSTDKAPCWNFIPLDCSIPLVTPAEAGAQGKRRTGRPGFPRPRE
jgi:hypothetical protein